MFNLFKKKPITCERCKGVEITKCIVSPIVTLKNYHPNKGDIKVFETKENVSICDHCGAYNWLQKEFSYDGIYMGKAYGTKHNFEERLGSGIKLNFNENEKLKIEYYYKEKTE